MDKEPTLGQKIQMYRERQGISQFKLEIEIGLAAGALSRIENGTVNPTKETIVKIIDALNLNPVEVSFLFNIERYGLSNLIRVTGKVSSSFNLEEILQNSVNEITYELNLLASVILTVSENRLYSNTFTETSFTKTYRALLNRHFSEYYVLLDTHLDNIIVQCINERRSIITNNLYDATKYAYSQRLTQVLSKLMGFKSGIACPLIYEDKPIGAIFYGKGGKTFSNFEIERPILEAFNEHITATIVNAQKYNNLKDELNKMKIK